MSSIQDMRAVVLTLLLASCAAPLMRLRPTDPAAHTQQLIAVHTSEPRSIVLEEVDQQVRLVEHSASGTRAVGIAGNIKHLGPAEWELLGKLGFVPFTQATTDSYHGLLAQADDRVDITEGDLAVPLLALGAAPSHVLWRSTPNSRFIGLEVSFKGAQDSRATYLIDPNDARKTFLVARASQAHAKQHFAQAVIDYTDALQLDPQNPLARYNLACALARLGQLNAALTRLREAIDFGGTRYQDFARQDPDFTDLQSTLAFTQLVNGSKP